MRLRACVLAIAVVLPIRAFAQTPPPAAASPAATPPVVEKPAEAAAPAPASAAPTAVVVTTPAMPPPAPAPVPTGPAPKFVFGGLVDTYYMYNFTPPAGANSLQPPQPVLGVGRAFDTNANSMTLALAKLTMNASLDVVSLQIDLGYGSVGSIINGSIDGGSPLAFPIGAAFLVEQAFGEITLPIGLPSFTLDFGKFTTTAGAEVIEANKNWLYSRSLLFNAIPLLHTGVRANLKVNDNLTLQASLVNGWNNDPDLNAWKTGGLSAAITVNPMLSIIATTYFGKELQPQAPAASTAGDVRFLGDLVAAITVNSQFGLNLNIDYIKAFDDVAADYQIGAALMGRYVINDHFNVAARGEFLASHIEAVPMLGPTTLKQGEGTVMLGIDVGKNFELRPELRLDVGSDPLGTGGIFAGGTKSSQFTGELAALTWF
jgi:hypothetical protein